MTPREFSACVEAYNENKAFETEQTQRAAYTTALLAAKFVWSKGRIPSYNEIFKKQTASEEMTDEQMLHQVEFLNALFGGTDTREEAAQCRQ